MSSPAVDESQLVQQHAQRRCHCVVCSQAQSPSPRARPWPHADQKLSLSVASQYEQRVWPSNRSLTASFPHDRPALTGCMYGLAVTDDTCCISTAQCGEHAYFFNFSQRAKHHIVCEPSSSQPIVTPRPCLPRGSPTCSACRFISCARAPAGGAPAVRLSHVHCTLSLHHIFWNLCVLACSMYVRTYVRLSAFNVLDVYDVHEVITSNRNTK